MSLISGIDSRQHTEMYGFSYKCYENSCNKGGKACSPFLSKCGSSSSEVDSIKGS